MRYVAAVLGAGRRGDAGPAPAEAAQPPPVIGALTGIRALAAVGVVLFHLRDPMYALLPATRVLDSWLVFGFLGVDVFFVLSGFVISYNYAERLASPDRRSYADFLAARFARIYPVHVVTLLVAAALMAYFAALGATLNPGLDRSLGDFLGNIVLLQAVPGVDAWNGASWSISCEAAAYLVFPLAAGLLLRLRRRSALVLGVVAVVLQWSASVWATSPSPSSTIALFWVRIAGEFTLGCLLWAAWRHGVRRRLGWDLAGGVALVAIGVILTVDLTRGFYWLVVPFIGLFVVAAASAAGPLRAVLASRPMEWGGRVSYSLYLVHVPVLVVVYLQLPYWQLTDAAVLGRVAVVVAYFAAAVVVAAAMYYAVEEPARRRLRRRAASWWDRDRTGSGVSPEPAALGLPTARTFRS